MTDLAPHLVVRTDTPQGPCAQLRGRWGAAELGTEAQWKAVAGQLRSHPASPTLAWDLRELQWLDHVGAQLLWNHWQHAWPAQLACTEAQRTMLERVAQFTCAAPPTEPWRLGEQADHLGVLVLHGLDHARHVLEMVGQLVLDLGRLARKPRRGPWRDVSGHLYRMGATALPITALVGFLIGVVLAYLMSLQLRQFGAESFIVNILGISLIRELGPMLAAILVAGRSGSAITAQIGVMRVTEELDAMRVMGIPHSFRLVLPRTLALALAMPLISVWTTLAALAGGMLRPTSPWTSRPRTSCRPCRRPSRWATWAWPWPSRWCSAPSSRSSAATGGCASSPTRKAWGRAPRRRWSRPSPWSSSWTRCLRSRSRI